MTRKQKVGPRTGIVFIITLCIVALGAFFMGQHKEKQEITVAKQLLKTDLTRSYPQTPRTLIKFYSKCIKELYNGKHDDKTQEELIMLVRKLYATELNEKNPEQQYLDNFRKDIQTYRKEKKKILNYEVASSEGVETWKKESTPYASLTASYTMQKKEKYFKTYEKFILKKEEEQWKIVGWTLSDKVDLGNEVR